MAFLVDLTIDDLQQEDGSRANTHQLISLASYGSASSPRYAAIWREKSNPRPRQIARFGQDEPFVATGPLVSPILLTMTGMVTRVGVETTVVYEEYEPNETVPKVSFVVASGVDELLEDTSATSEPLAVDAVWYLKEESGKVQFRVAGLFRAKVAKAVWGVYLTPAEVEDHHLRWAPSVAAAAQSFKRVHFAIPSPSTTGGKRQALVVMRGDAYEPWRDDLNEPLNPFLFQEGGTLVDGPFPVSHFNMNVAGRQQEMDLTPIAVSANGYRTKAGLCVTWAPRATPLWVRSRLIDGAEAGPASVAEEQDLPAAHSQLSYDEATQETLQSMRKWVRDEMDDKNISNAQVAIAYRGRLKVLWSFTRGEEGWPLTQPTSKFRVASSIKIVTAMLAVSLGESFLKRKLPEALGLLDVAPSSGSLDVWSLQKWGWFADTTIEDCLQHLGCFSGKGGWSASFEQGREELPLRAGDFTLALRQGAWKKLVVRAPRTYEGYNNWGYMAVGEAISRALQGGKAGRFFEALQDWVTTGVADNIGFIPKTREACLDFGEVPVRSRGCAPRNTQVPHDTLKAVGVPLPPFAPGGYDFDDYDLWGPTGGLTMSLATFVRLLQMLHPEEASSELTGARLRIDQLFRMLQRYPEPVPNELSNGVAKPTSFGLGAKVGLGRSPFNMSWGKPQRGPKPAQGAEWELTWGGNLPSGQSGFAHFVFPRPDGTDFLSNPDSLTVAWITNNGQKLGSLVANLMVSDLRAGAIAIQQQGGWDNDVDLFPALGLL